MLIKGWPKQSFFFFFLIIKWINGDSLGEGLCHTQICCTQSPCHSHWWPIPPQDTLKHRQVWLSLCGVSWCMQFLFEPSEHLWWVWNLILNAISPLLSSCWGFSFVLGCGVSFFWWDPAFSCRWLFSEKTLVSGETRVSGLFWGNRLLEGTNKTLCAPGPRRKEQLSHKRLTQSCLWVSRSLWWRRGSMVACRIGGTECSSACTGPFEGDCHFLHYLHHSLVSGQTTGREQSPAYQQKIGLKIYWAWSSPSEQDPVSPTSQSLPSGSFQKPLCLIPQRADRMKTTVTEN